MPKKAAGLSRQQVRMCQLLAAGKTLKEVGFEMELSERTVSSTMTAVRKKVGAGSNIQALLIVEKRGWLK